MSRKNKKNEQVRQAAADMATIRRAQLLADLRDGRSQRAVRFTDRRKEADRRACRDRNGW